METFAGGEITEVSEKLARTSWNKPEKKLSLRFFLNQPGSDDWFDQGGVERLQPGDACLGFR